MTNKVIYILNGPNLNLLGKRQTDIYGTESMESALLRIQHAHPDLYIQYHQSNHEGDLIDWLQEIVEKQNSCNADECACEQACTLGVILNAGGYTHTSVSIRDAVAYVRENDIPVVEVHLSDISQREDFRRVSLLTDVCTTTLMGHGIKVYEEATTYLIATTPAF